MATLQDVHNLTRAHLGERQTPPEVFTDAFLLTLSPEVYREIQRRYGAAGIPHLFDVVTFNIASGVQIAGPGVTAGWPAAGIIKPIRLWERAAASVNFGDFVLMEEADPELIPRAPLPTLTHWEWGAYTIAFIASSTNRNVRMQYTKYLADLVALTDVLLILDSLDAMANGLAASASLSRGAIDKAKSFESLFDASVQLLIDNDKARSGGA